MRVPVLLKETCLPTVLPYTRVLFDCKQQKQALADLSKEVYEEGRAVTESRDS
jgi:hypothetical protein